MSLGVQKAIILTTANIYGDDCAHHYAVALHTSCHVTLTPVTFTAAPLVSATLLFPFHYSESESQSLCFHICPRSLQLILNPTAESRCGIHPCHSSAPNPPGVSQPMQSKSKCLSSGLHPDPNSTLLCPQFLPLSLSSSSHSALSPFLKHARQASSAHFSGPAQAKARALLHHGRKVGDHLFQTIDKLVICWWGKSVSIAHDNSFLSTTFVTGTVAKDKVSDTKLFYPDRIYSLLGDCSLSPTV